LGAESYDALNQPASIRSQQHERQTQGNIYPIPPIRHHHHLRAGFAGIRLAHGRCTMKVIEVYGRRWRDPFGNTYHTTHIKVEGQPMYTSPITYGYGDHYYHSTAIEWLASNGYLTSDRPIREARDIGIQYEVEDVKRRRDLGGEWLQTQDARDQLRKNPRDRICPNCGLTCIDMYRFAVPCNPELARGGE
jgi:hypothetical protein